MTVRSRIQKRVLSWQEMSRHGFNLPQEQPCVRSCHGRCHVTDSASRRNSPAYGPVMADVTSRIQPPAGTALRTVLSWQMSRHGFNLPQVQPCVGSCHCRCHVTDSVSRRYSPAYGPVMADVMSRIQPPAGTALRTVLSWQMSCHGFSLPQEQPCVRSCHGRCHVTDSASRRYSPAFGPVMAKYEGPAAAQV